MKKKWRIIWPILPIIVMLITYILGAIIFFPTHSQPILTGEEIVKDKPQEYNGLNDKALSFQKGVAIGELFASASIFDGGISNEGRRNIFLYAWVWKDSVSLIEDNSLVFLKSENIRVAANRTIIGTFNEGATGIVLRENSRKSWILARFDMQISEKQLGPERSSIFSFEPTERTVTTSDGGEYPDEITPEIQLFINLALIVREHGWKLLGLTVALSLVFALLNLSRHSITKKNSTKQIPTDTERKEQ